VLDLIIIAGLAKLSERGRWIGAGAIVIGAVVGLAIWIGAGAALFGFGLFSTAGGIYCLMEGRRMHHLALLQHDKAVARPIILGGVKLTIAGMALLLTAVFYTWHFGDADPLPGLMKPDDD